MNNAEFPPIDGLQHADWIISSDVQMRVRHGFSSSGCGIGVIDGDRCSLFGEEIGVNGKQGRSSNYPCSNTEVRFNRCSAHAT